MNANNATNVEGSLVDGTPTDKDDWDFEDAVRLNEVERGSPKRQFWYFQEPRRVKLWKVPDTVANAVELVDELIRQVDEQFALVSKNTAPVAVSSEGTEIVPLTTSLQKAWKGSVIAKSELDGLCAAAEFAKNEHNFAWTRL